MMSAQTLQRRGTTSARILSPDAARGFALLGIALANIPTAWVGYELVDRGTMLGGIQPGAEGVHRFLDQLMMVLGAMFAHVRGLPMFSTLLGFGVGLISLSLARRGFPLKAAWKVLIRRYGFLALFGFLHAVFLFYGDIMLMYGIMAVVLALMIGFSNKVLKWIAVGLYALNGLVFTVIFASTFFVDESDLDLSGYVANPETYLGWMGLGLMTAIGVVPMTLFSGLCLFPMIIVGFIFARSGVLHRPDEHLTTLRTWAGVAAAVILLIGLPWGLAEIGVLNDAWASRFMILNQIFGYLTGPGIVAFFALMLRGAQKRYEETGVVPVLLRAPVALGKRSMSGYLMQSVVLFILTLPFTLGLFVDAGATVLTLVGVGTWLITLVLAWVLEVAKLPGPFEWLHRRLSYGKNGLPLQWALPQRQP